jgi:two-component system phosphate regulon sensor histidine kinase PhoR
MFNKNLTLRLLMGYLCVIILPLLVASWYTSTLYKKFYFGEIIGSEKKNAYLVGGDILPFLGGAAYGKVDSLCKRLSREIGMRITVVLPSGRVIGDSDKDPDSMENHRYRPEIMRALDSNNASRSIPGTANRYSTTLRQMMVYVAVPVRGPDGIAAVVRTAMPLESATRALHEYYARIAVAGILLALLAVLLSWLLARQIIVPVRSIKNGAERFAQGELASRIELPSIEELRHLAGALNTMAAQLDGRIKTITAQRNEQEAIFASMTEGVIAIDASGHVLSVNKAAAFLFAIDTKNAPGRLLGEVLRNSAFLHFAARILKDTEPAEEDILVPSLHDGSSGDRILQLHGSVLRSGDGRCVGAVLVASDVTRLRRLESMRKEFVANVSHELRTPLTTIKGFVETLLAGAIDSREEAQRFLTIISGQAERLTSLVEDLLTLALIEREEEARSPAMELRPVIDVVQAAMRDQAAHAAAKNIRVTAKGDPALAARLNAPLLEQAIGNLIDNAIKYSEPDREITVSAAKSDGDIIVAVSDQGMGIPREHLDRIFERFYRVDKARSRKMGGTGLGLAIVKHIAGLHGGRCAVQSEPGRGSTFTISFPANGGNDGGQAGGA